MTSPESPPAASPLLAALGLDLEGGLAQEPRFLTDGLFLGALHGELFEELPEDEAAGALLQLGFVHGLRDALLVVRRLSADGALPRTDLTPAAPRVPMQLARMAPGAPSFELRGSWPESLESQAAMACVGRGEGARCFASAGYTSGWASGLFGADLVAVETDCAASGDPRCRFVVREAAEWRDTGHAEGMRRAAALPFAQLRELVARDLERQPPPRGDEAAFDAGAPVVHVWGPVMILPFSGLEESLRALDLIRHDPGARGVRVVVIDVSGMMVDESLGASALEQLVDAVEQCGAEPVLAGVTPCSEPAVAELQAHHVLVQKDLEEAIVAAFQIAEAQRLSA